jgi:transposase
MAILLYTLGLSFNAVARIYGVATSTVMRWVRAFAEKTYEKPEPKQAVIIELDEMWHYLHAKKQTPDLESLLSRYRSAH